MMQKYRRVSNKVLKNLKKNDGILSMVSDGKVHHHQSLNFSTIGVKKHLFPLCDHQLNHQQMLTISNEQLSGYHDNMVQLRRQTDFDQEEEKDFDEEEERKRIKKELQEEKENKEEEEELLFDDVVELASTLTPKEIVEELSKHIIGQEDAKRAVAIAMRNRWRRRQLPKDIQSEIIPKNILMIGPTGVGKTEVARRMAKLADAPFIKVEATKFTEVGYHGRDVDSIIRDLVEVSLQITKDKLKGKLKDKVERNTENQILKILNGTSRPETANIYRKMLRDGDLDEREIEVDIPQKMNAQIISPVGDMYGGDQLNDFMLKMFPSKTKKSRMKIKDCRPLIEEMEYEKLLNKEDVTKEAIRAVEQESIVFIDEIDKICDKAGSYKADASSEGVQRDLLPLVEGTTISTKHGNINTDHILFIASGAFHQSKPSDMLGELQGRLPIRVELKALNENDLKRILREPQHNILRQNMELLTTEGVKLHFTDDGIDAIAKAAFELNSTVQNLGARRLITIIEKVLEEISFEAEKYNGKTFEVDEKYVDDHIVEFKKKSDLSKYLI